MEPEYLISAAVIITLSSTSVGLNMRANYRAVTVREGEALELACSADQEMKQCSFTTAQGTYRAVHLYSLGQEKGAFLIVLFGSFPNDTIKNTSIFSPNPDGPPCTGRSTREPVSPG